MVTLTGIDRDAPVVTHHQVDIAAPLDVVWHLHTEVNGWPSWNLEITAAKIEGEFEEGNSFTWTSWGPHRHLDHSRRGTPFPHALVRARARHHGRPRVAL